MFLENNRKIWSERCSKFKYFFCKNLENNKIPNFWEMECLLFGKIFPTTWIILYPFAFDRYHGKLFFFSESCLNSLHWTLNKYAREFLDDRSVGESLALLRGFTFALQVSSSIDATNWATELFYHNFQYFFMHTKFFVFFLLLK